MNQIISYLNNLSKLNFNLGPQTLFAGLVLVFLLLWGLSLGRTRALISLLGIYVAFALEAIFPYFKELQDVVNKSSLAALKEPYALHIALFLVLYAIIFAILNRTIIKSRMTIKEASFLSVGIISLLQVSLLASIITNKLPADMVSKISYAKYFSTRTALFGWSVIPVIFLLFLRNTKKHKERAD